MEKYEEYLEKTRQTNIDYTDTQGSNLRLNLQEHIHLPADPIDIITSVQNRNRFYHTNSC
jgi:hypothetical protein